MDAMLATALGKIAGLWCQTGVITLLARKPRSLGRIWLAIFKVV